MNTVSKNFVNWTPRNTWISFGCDHWSSPVNIKVPRNPSHKLTCLWRFPNLFLNCRSSMPLEALPQSEHRITRRGTYNMRSAIFSLYLSNRVGCIVPCNSICCFAALKMIKFPTSLQQSLMVVTTMFSPWYTDGKNLWVVYNCAEYYWKL